MALQFLDQRLVGAYLVDAWQNHLNTEKDPADGQWFTNGPGNNGGLYGKLVDVLASELVFDSNKKVFSPHQLAADSHTVDNRNGLTKPTTITVTYAYQDSTSTTHSTTNALKLAEKTTLKVKGDFILADTELTQELSAEYSWSWTDSSSKTTTETRTFQQSITVVVPEGKVYQVVLMVNKNDLTIPYSANIYLDGTSSACFATPVNGQKIWTVDAGTLCAWINQYASADKDSSLFGRDPANAARGMISLRGTLTATDTRNFILQTFDITSSYQGAGAPQVSLSTAPGSPAIAGAPLVDQRKLT